MKRLYLMRHGHAPTAAEARVGTDALRPLSEKGAADAARCAADIAARGGRPDLILHSPLRRAVQTAAAVAAVLKPARGTELFAPLDNSLPADEVLAALLARGNEASEVLAIGHIPQLAELATSLTKALYEIHPAGVVAVELEPKPRLLWTSEPAVRS